MHYSPVTYRPPYEAGSALLQVTTGCSHNRCAFCSMYRDVAFRPSPLEEVARDVAELARERTGANRVFLAGGDAFCLPAARLLEIAELIHDGLPRVEKVAAYASVRNIAAKTDGELAELARQGFDELSIGVESALDDVLAWMGKGHDVAMARAQLGRLARAGMSFFVDIVDAAAGPGRIVEHARANAAFLNEVSPKLVFVSPLHVDAGTELWHMAQAGEFMECTLGEYLDEEIALLEDLRVEGCYFYGWHVSNPVAVGGWLPQEKGRLLAELRRGKAAIPGWQLAMTPPKGPEGRLIL